MITRRAFGAGIAGSVVWLDAGQTFAQGTPAAPAAPAPTGPPTIEELIEIPRLVDAAVSPDGKTIATLNQTTKYKSRAADDNFSAFINFRSGDTLADISTAQLGKMAVYSLNWLDNDRVLVRVFDLGRQTIGNAIGAQAGAGIMVLHKTTRQAMYLPPGGSVLDLMPEDPDHVMMIKGVGPVPALMLTDTHTGVAKEIERGNTNTITYHIQNGKPVVRIDWDKIGGKVQIYYGREPGKTEWKEFGRFHYDSVIGNEFDIVGVSPSKPGVLWVSTNAEGENYRPLREYNVGSKTWGATLSRQNGDAVDCIRDSTGEYVGAVYIDDTAVFDCTDPQMTAQMTDLSAAFPGSSLTVRGVSRDRTRLICKVSGPHNAGSYVFYDRTSAKLGPLGNARPWLSPDRLPTGAKLDARSRDGTVIRAYLTIPVGGGKKPMVVMPHGGPETRDQVQFDTWAQTIAARGYYILQPNYRGSGGLGKAVRDAGDRQWNGIVQEDIEACVVQALASYPIDRDKIAIVGGSFGGYAALMGAVRNPSVYKAVVGMDGLYDLAQFLRREKEDGETSLGYLYWRKEIGDLVADADLIKRSSPSERAAEIKAPVLLIHGASDLTVNVEETRTMGAAIRRAGGSIQEIIIPGMGHGPSTYDDAKHVYEEIIKFLDEKLANAPPAGAARGTPGGPQVLNGG